MSHMKYEKICFFCLFWLSILSSARGYYPYSHNLTWYDINVNSAFKHGRGGSPKIASWLFRTSGGICLHRASCTMEQTSGCNCIRKDWRSFSLFSSWEKSCEFFCLSEGIACLSTEPKVTTITILFEVGWYGQFIILTYSILRYFCELDSLFIYVIYLEFN